MKMCPFPVVFAFVLSWYVRFNANNLSLSPMQYVIGLLMLLSIHVGVSYNYYSLWTLAIRYIYV